jgi:hypothetical protein
MCNQWYLVPFVFGKSQYLVLLLPTPLYHKNIDTLMDLCSLNTQSLTFYFLIFKIFVFVLFVSSLSLSLSLSLSHGWVASPCVI